MNVMLLPEDSITLKKQTKKMEVNEQLEMMAETQQQRGLCILHKTEKGTEPRVAYCAPFSAELTHHHHHQLGLHRLTWMMWNF